MNRAFPFAEVEPGAEHWRALNDALAGVVLPDEDDRHVLASADAAEATVLCTSNVKDFPAEVMEVLGVNCSRSFLAGFSFADRFLTRN